MFVQTPNYLVLRHHKKNVEVRTAETPSTLRIQVTIQLNHLHFLWRTI